PGPVAGAVIDVSFVSLRLVLPNVFGWIRSSGWAVALVKPQFEAGRHQVGRGGIVRDPAVHAQVLEDVGAAVERLGWHVTGTTPSPILGAEGNREFLIEMRCAA